MKKNSHCSYCGAAYPELTWPRHCAVCKQTTWRNPTPVAVVVVPVDDSVLLVRRNIEPQVGKLALPGGYIDFGETWQQGCARELMEETGVRIDPNLVTLLDVHSATDAGALLMFGLAPKMRTADLPSEFAKNDEVIEVVLTNKPVELAFSFHQLVLDRYFERQSRP